ncbi:MAG: hypothetical protein ACI4CB_01945 [Prevotella sp.]|nr:hypothetical protein [Prevotella sp.]
MIQVPHITLFTHITYIMPFTHITHIPTDIDDIPVIPFHTSYKL